MIVHLSRTEPMLRRYPAGSTCASGAFGRAILGKDILVLYAGVMGDLREVCEDTDLTSPTLGATEELWRVLPDATELDLSLREKIPMLCCGACCRGG